MPYDYIKTGDPGRRFHAVDFKFTNDMFSWLMRLSTGSDVKLHILLMAGVLVLIDKYTYNQTNDIIVGTTIQKQNTTGTFTNTVLPLRNQINGNLTFKELVFQVRETIVEAAQNQSYPMEILLDELNLPSPGPGFPLFEIAILLENIHDKTYLRDTSPYVVFSFLRTDTCIKGSLEYNACLYRQTTIKRLISHFTHLMMEIVDNLDSRLSGLSVLSEVEKTKILVDFNSDRQDYPKDKTTHELFEEQVEKTPDNNSVKFEDKHLTYETLNKRANQLARLLRRQGMNQGNNVGLMLDRSLEMIIGILGILKAGGSYLPIEPGYPEKRINYMLGDSETGILLTKFDIINRYSFTGLQNLSSAKASPWITDRRPQITDLDRLPFPGRIMINYEKYHRYIGVAPVKNNISILATRGCPYKCAYCHKIWPKKHIVRSAENVFEEVQIFYNLGIRRFTIIDDIFNLNIRNSSRFFQLIIEDGMDIQLFFPNGLRGDILTTEYIDLMVKAGTRGIALALESASPRIQKLIKKNLNLEKLRENIDYICNRHPHVILELQTMIGFPTETEEEAAMTLDFIKCSKWLHFPYLHILKIYQNTDMGKLAMENGVSLESIIESEHLAYHELPGTLSFSKNFALKFQSDFLNDYFLLKERLLQVLPHQMKILSEDEMVQKYNSYLPVDIYCFDDLLQFHGVTREELTAALPLAEEDHMAVPHFNEKLKQYYPAKTVGENALRILLLDLSQYFSAEMSMLYEVVEVPLGLMYLLTYLQEQFGNRINGKIAKSRIDFDNYLELKVLINEFNPDVIGIRTLTRYKDFFHKTVTMIRQWGIKVPIIAGGPYATSDYETLLQDRNVDLVVLGEGEITFRELIGKMIENQGKLPQVDTLKDMMGFAFIPDRKNKANRFNREIFLLDEGDEILSRESEENLTCSNAPSDLAYTLFTSGSTGKPKGVLIEHQSINNLVIGLNKRIYRHYTSGQNVSLLAPYVFDASVQQIFAVLLLGHCLHIVPEDIRIDGSRLLGFYKRHQISISDGTPTHIRLMVESAGEAPLELNLKNLVIGGEALPRALVERFFNGFGKNPPKITNIYGVTECCVDSTSYEITPENIHSFDCVPIGTPMPNQQIYILSKENQLQPIGVPGELCIGGDGLGRGYLKRETLTSEKFVTNPFQVGQRMFKTGDLARWLPDENIDFLGRNDHQVKIRGFRIELGEIENQLMNYKKNKNLKNVLNKDMAQMIDSNENILCAACLLPAGYPDLRLDEQGVCNYCHSFENYREQARKYFKSRDEFRTFMEKAKETKGSQYDCLLLYSGGKDSTYVLYRLVEQGLKLLAFTFDNGYISQTAFENIKRTTDRLKVDSIVCTAENMDRIFLQSLNDDDTVCTGCFKALTTLSTELAYKKGINVVITGLSRGQIFDTKLHGLFQQGIFEIQEIEEKLLTFRKIYHSINDVTSKRLNIQLPDEVFSNIYFVDFFKYEEVSANQVKVYLKRKDTYWQQPKDTGFCSTNCMINDVGIYVHFKNRGYHNYAAPLSWDCRLGLLERSEGLKEIRFDVNMERVERILNKIGYFTEQINDAVVTVKEDETGENALCAYFVANSELDIRELREYLREKLPDYMVPTYLIPLDQMPLTPNGKLDRKALPMSKFDVIAGRGKHTTPRNDLEEKLAGIWSGVLGIEKDKISIDSNFFELGGHSLKATILISRIHKELNVIVQLAEIFKTSTIRGLAKFIKQTAEHKFESIKPVEKKEYYPLSSAQKRMYILQRVDLESTVYNISAAMAITLERELYKEKFEDIFCQLINRHESLRTHFKCWTSIRYKGFIATWNLK